MTSPTESPITTPGAHLEPRIRTVGLELAASMSLIVASLPGGAEAGPQQLAEALGVDKVLTHRVLKAIRQEDPLSCVYHAPGPDPLRRFMRRAKQRGLNAALVQRAQSAISQFESLVRDELGNRSALASVLASFLPEARLEFETRRKQSAYRAMSELLGYDCDVNLNSIFVHPSNNGSSLDIAWMMGYLGLRRLRPGVTVKFATKQQPEPGGSDLRYPYTIDGEQGSAKDYLLDQLWTEAPAPVKTLKQGDCLHYVLGETGFGPNSKVDLLLGESGQDQMPMTVPEGSGRRRWFYGSTTIPAKTMLLDVHVHRDVFQGSDPDLLLYNSHESGIADVNDISRDIDRLDWIETIQYLGEGLDKIKTRVSPHHKEITSEIFRKLGWDASEFRVWRTHIDYPVYGVQAVMAFDPPEMPDSERDRDDEMRQVWR
jgi:hypothetical protein